MDGRYFQVIARIHTDFPTKFGIPRQSGLIPDLKAEIVFEPEYRNPDALRGIEEFSHLWLIWVFDRSARGPGPPLCGRRALAVISEWEFSPPALLFGQPPLAFPAGNWRGLRRPRRGALCFGCGAQTWRTGVRFWISNPIFPTPTAIPARWRALPPFPPRRWR